LGGFHIDKTKITLNNGKEINIFPPEEDENLIYKIDEIITSHNKPSRYDSHFNNYTQYIIKLDHDPDLIEPFLVHNSHYYIKDEATNRISEDPIFPGFVLLKNEKICKEVIKKVNDQKPIKKEELKKKFKERFAENLIDFGFDMFAWSFIAGKRLMDKDEKLKSMIHTASKRKVNIKKISSRLKKIMPEQEDIFDEKEIEESIKEYYRISPAMINDFLKMWLYEKFESLVSFSQSFRSENCLNLDDYEQIEELIEKLENFNLLYPLLTLSICKNPGCEYQSISNNKITTIECPNCKTQGSLFSAIVYKFDDFVYDLQFTKKIVPEHSYTSYMISHYLYYHTEGRANVFPLRYVSFGEKPPEEIDVLALKIDNEPIIFECKIHRDRIGDFDQIFSCCKNGLDQLERKMAYIGSTKGYLVTNFSNEKTIQEINKKLKTKDKGIRILSSEELIGQLHKIVNDQFIHNIELESN
jgi:hypothetical protein